MSRGLFFELLQVSVGTRDALSRVPAADEWRGLYAEALRQSLVGVTLTGVERLFARNAAFKPPVALFYEWVGAATQIEKKNRALDDAAAQLHRIFRNGGLRTCVLKGQGLSRLYPTPERRQPGDVDLWVEGTRASTLRFLRRNFFGTGKVVIHHVDARIIDGVETEIHFWPSYCYAPLRYRRYLRFFREEADEQFGHYADALGFARPTFRFNAVYLLLHVFRHVFNEGIGLRQLLDYYFTLLRLTEDDRRWAFGWLRSMGLARMSAAVMYVLQRVFLLEDSCLLCAPSERWGRFLLEEICLGGNFGQYDARRAGVRGKGGVGRYFANLRRLSRIFRLCPSEVLWAPLWKCWHWVWRRLRF